MAASTLKMQVIPVFKTMIVSPAKKNLWALLFAVGVVAPVFWMVVDRDPPYEITNGKVDPAVPVKNGMISVTWDVKPLRNCTVGMVTRRLVDSKGVVHTYQPIATTYGTDKQPNEDEIQRAVKLPENITGHVKYSSRACYPCNPLQIYWPICIETPVLEFDIADTKP